MASSRSLAQAFRAPPDEIVKTWTLSGGLKATLYRSGNVHVDVPAGGVTWSAAYLNSGVRAATNELLHALRQKEH